MAQHKVVVDPAFRKMEEIFSELDRRRLEDLCSIVWGQDEPMPEAEARTAVLDADAVVCSQWRYGDSIYQARRLKAIFSVSGGFQTDFDYEYCHQRHIQYLSCAPAFGPQVAEMALGLAIAAARTMVTADRDFRAGQETYLWDSNRDTFTLFDKPVGFIGFGGLAQNLRQLLQPFRPRIQVYDPWLSDGYIRSQGCTPVSLPELMSQNRFVFVLAVPSADNSAMIDRSLLERLGPDTVFLLMSRAHVVDFDALTDLLQQGRFRAGIDVFPEEPLASDHPIRNVDNAILSAHRAGSVPEALWDIGRMVVDDLEAVLNDLPARRMQPALPQLTGRYARNAARRGRRR